MTLAGVVVALRAVYSTYTGWNSCAYFCEEVHEPGRNMVRSLFIGLGVLTTLFVLVNVGLLHALTIPQIAASNLPVADAVGQLLGARGQLVTTVFALISVAAITNLTVMCCTRIVFGMARNGALPSPLAGVGKSGTPQIALAFTVLGGVACASTGVYESLMAIGTTFAMLVAIGVDLAALRLRRTEPDLPRPYRMPFFPLPALTGLAINGALLMALVHEDPQHSLSAVVLSAAIGVVYFVRARLIARRAVA